MSTPDAATSSTGGARVRLAIVGCGQRGTVYATYAAEYPDLCCVIALADPIAELAKLGKIADAVVVATPDALHFEPTMAFLAMGCHVLCEKPLAVEESHCRMMAEAAVRNRLVLCVGHVMRYAPYTCAIKQMVSEGRIGRVVSIQHHEPVGYWHFAHSYVRGNWRNTASSTFSLMAKSCHDLDWIRHIVGSPCTRVHSFGSLSHFKPSEQPAEALGAARCVQCPIERTCPYSATRIYGDSVARGVTTWPVSVIVPNAVPDVENVADALRTGPYGRCVYHCDNNVCDQQVVSMEFANGATASFSMIAFTQDICVRKSRVFGTHGMIEADGSAVTYRDFRTGQSGQVPVEPTPKTRLMGHGGADFYLMRAFVQAVRTGDRSLVLSGPQETLESHLAVFAAEKSRLEGNVQNVKGI